MESPILVCAFPRIGCTISIYHRNHIFPTATLPIKLCSSYRKAIATSPRHTQGRLCPVPSSFQPFSAAWYVQETRTLFSSISWMVLVPLNWTMASSFFSSYSGGDAGYHPSCHIATAFVSVPNALTRPAPIPVLWSGGQTCTDSRTALRGTSVSSSSTKSLYLTR